MITNYGWSTRLNTNGLWHKVHVDYHQVFVAPFNVDPALDAQHAGRLLVVAPDGPSLIIFTGCATGAVHVTARGLTAPPEGLAASLTRWEIGVEDNIHIETELFLRYTMDTTLTEPVFTPTRAGLHRVRVLARGRAANYDLAVLDSGEEYDISIWPVESGSDRISIGDDGLDL